MRDLIKNWLLARAIDSFAAPQGVNLRSDYELLPDLLSEALMKTVNFLQSIELHEAEMYNTRTGGSMMACTLRKAVLISPLFFKW